MSTRFISFGFLKSEALAGLPSDAPTAPHTSGRGANSTPRLRAVGLPWREALLGLSLAAALTAGAQTVLVSEGFEGLFPGSWTLGDATHAGVNWGSVGTGFGTVAAHTSSWKGYCAGTGYGGTSANPTYANSMTATMSRSVNLAGYTGANLRFWVNIPSIEASLDFFRVFMDTTQVYSRSSATAGWIPVTVSLKPFVGGTHTLRFEFDSDSSGVFEGAYLDDIVVDAASQPFVENLQSLQNANYTGYVLDSDTTQGRSNIQAQATFSVENFTGTTTGYTNVLSFRLINQSTGLPHPIYDVGNAATNAAYAYNLTNVLSLSSATNLSLTETAFIRPAAWMSQFNQYYLECKLLTNGIVVNSLTTPPATYYHFTNVVNGDTAYNALLALDNSFWTRTYAVRTIPGQNSFQVTANYEIRRWDDWNSGISSVNIPVQFSFTLRDNVGNVVPLTSNSQIFLDSVPNYQAPNNPVVQSGVHTLDVRPSGQLQTVNSTYYLTVTLSHTNNPVTGQTLTANTLSTTVNELLHFNGTLYFGGISGAASIPTVLTGLGSPVPPVNAPSGGVIPTTLTAAGGYVAAKSDHAYSGAALNVTLYNDGSAVVTGGGSVTLSAPAIDTDNVNGIKFQRGTVTLSAAGGAASVTMTLPTGFGYRLNDTSSRVLTASVPFSGVALSYALYPDSDLTYLPPGGTLYAVEESKPVWLASDRIIWQVSAGQVSLHETAAPVFVQAADYAYLHSIANILLRPISMGDKRSNDKFWLALSGTGSDPVVVPDPYGNALLSGQFLFNPNSDGYHTHFPYDAVVQWFGSGLLSVTNDLADSAASYLSGASQVAVTYSVGCSDCDTNAPTHTPAILITNNQFTFTLDGGLVAAGTMPHTDLQWGYSSAQNSYAQQATNFTDAAFHMPGAFLRGDQHSPVLDDEQRPTTILLTGFRAADLSVVERPWDSGYIDGFADYAGLNFRAYVNRKGALSTIADQKDIPWDLDSFCKYYVRFGGVSGIHEAVPGSFPSTATLWNYHFTFTSHGLSYLDSQNWDSITEGSIALPYPAHFTQNFTKLHFSCNGAPTQAGVPPTDGPKVMEYWLADFKSLSMRFSVADACVPGLGTLVLGIEGHASHVDKPLYGEIGFDFNGDQVPQSRNPQLTSRLKLPNLITLEGPNHTSYTLTPVQEAYYNTYANSPPGPTPGWINIYGSLAVPFFNPLQVQLQTSCLSNSPASSNAVTYLVGGWPDASHAWMNGSPFSPFQTSFFDPANQAWPGSAVVGNIDQYRNNSTENYHPRAQRTWASFINFDYPLSWNSSLRSFKSVKPITTPDLLVVKVQQQVKYMDAKHVEIDFGAQYDGLPTISIANLAFNALDELTGVSDAIVKTVSQPVEDVLKTGLDEMDQLLDPQMKRVMDRVLDQSVDPLIDTFYSQLLAQWNLSPGDPNFGAWVASQSPALLGAPLASVLQDLGDGLHKTTNIIGQIEGYLTDATNAIESVIGTVGSSTNGTPISPVLGLIAKGVGGNRPVVPKLIQSLVGDLAPQYLNSVLGPVVSNAVQDIEPQLTEVTDALKQVENVLAQARGSLGVAGDFTAEINNTLNALNTQLQGAAAAATANVAAYFNQFDYSVDNPFVHISPADLKKFIRQKIEDQFFGTGAAAQIQTTLRQRLYDLDSAMKQGIDSAFQEVNTVTRDIISQSLAGIDDSINQCLGDISEVIGAGKLNGHADIVGDSLKLLRIDGHFQFKVPTDMEFDAYLEIKELNSDGNPSGCSCYASHKSATEVTIGAKGVPLEFAGTDAKINAEAKFVFDIDSTKTPPIFPINMGGTLQLDGKLDFQEFSLHDLAASLAFGACENYIALKGGVKFDGYDFSGAIFFGHSCDLTPLELIDKDVKKVIGDLPSITGVYCYAQGWLPISELVLGIPASCMFEISAGVGAGGFVFTEGPTVGGKMFLGVSGSLLCVVSIEGDVTLYGVAVGNDLRFNGHGHFEADLGWCPFCISISKDIDVTYANKSWHID